MNGVQRTGDTTFSKGVIDLSVTINLATAVEYFCNDIATLLSHLHGWCRRFFLATTPIIKAALGHLQNVTHYCNGIMLSMVIDPGVLCGYMTSFAKYAVAFFKMSFSI